MYRTLNAVVVMLAGAMPLAAGAQDATAAKREDLDVTLRIITSPDARLPDEIVRRIPLPPAPRADDRARARSTGEQSAADERANEVDSKRDSSDFGREMSERARDLAKEAAAQREDAGRSIAEEARRNNPGPPNPPPGGPPSTPPGRP